MTTLADDLVPDELWALVAPLLPVPPRPPYGGRHRAIPDRNCFAAIVCMARTSTPWRLLPVQELGCGSPSTRWRRLTEWANAGVFDQLHLEVLDRLGAQGRLDRSRASMDTLSVRTKRGGPCGRKSGRSWQAREQAAGGLRARLLQPALTVRRSDTTSKRSARAGRTSTSSATRTGRPSSRRPPSTRRPGRSTRWSDRRFAHVACDGDVFGIHGGLL
jgi:transposase